MSKSLVSHMSLPSQDDQWESAVWSAESPWLYLPEVLVQSVCSAVGVTLLLAAIKLEFYTHLSWWIVLLPISVALSVVFIVFSIAVIAWIRVSVAFLCGGDEEVDAEYDFRLLMFLRTAKIAFLCHGHLSLLMLSFGLLLIKIQFWPSLPVVYPLLPLIVLGMVYMFLALVFTQTEVDPHWFFVIGMSLVSQSIMLVVKLDHFQESKALPWAATFSPSWIAYVLLLIYCILSPLQIFRQASIEHDSQNAGRSEAPYTFHSSDDDDDERPSSSALLNAQIFKVLGIGCWAIGSSLSQALLTLRLDAVHKVSWMAVTMPALFGWIVFTNLVSGCVSEYSRDVAQLFLDGLFCVPTPCPIRCMEEQRPLLMPNTYVKMRANSTPRLITTDEKWLLSPVTPA